MIVYRLVNMLLAFIMATGFVRALRTDRRNWPAAICAIGTAVALHNALGGRLMKTSLTFGGYRECSGCSKGLHRDHVPVECDCSLCAEETA